MSKDRTPITSIRIDPKLKADAVEVFDRLHITMTSAINMFLSEVVRTQGIPLSLDTSKDKKRD